MSIPTSETLNRAADLIEERGWTSGEGWEHEKGGPLCLEGGILAAIGGSFAAGDLYLCPAYSAVREYLRERTDRSPFMWNDRLAFDRIMSAIERGDTIGPDAYEAVKTEAAEWAAREVVSVLRACAVIEASRERESVEVSV